jgi:hypothetical protein
MKKTLAIALAVAGLSTSGAAFAQSADTSSTTATSSVTIIRPLTINKIDDLVFGRIVQPRSGTGTVAMTAASDTLTAGAGAVALGGTTPKRAKFTVTGEAAQVVNVTKDATVTMSNGTDSIPVTLNWDTGASFTFTGTVGASATKDIYAGGNFSVDSALSSGAYTGTFNISVAYN